MQAAGLVSTAVVVMAGGWQFALPFFLLLLVPPSSPGLVYSTHMCVSLHTWSFIPPRLPFNLLSPQLSTAFRLTLQLLLGGSLV
jgi:hypothetical protein